MLIIVIHECQPPLVRTMSPNPSGDWERKMYGVRPSQDRGSRPRASRRVRFEQGRVWKRFDFGVMDSLHEKGYITTPRNRSESVYLTDNGLRAAKSLAARYFGRPV